MCPSFGESDRIAGNRDEGRDIAVTSGVTDDFSYNIVENPVDVHDLHATMLHLLGVQHTRLTYKYQGRHIRLTDVKGNVVRDLLA